MNAELLMSSSVAAPVSVWASSLRPSLNTSSPLAGGTMADLLRLLGADPRQGPMTSQGSLSVRRVRKGNALFHEGATADCLYVIRFGAFKTYRTDEEGYEQVLDFVGHADILGLDTLSSGQHPSTAVALEDASVYTMLMGELYRWRQQCPAFDEVLQRSLSSQLARRYEMAEVMAAMGAEVRVARFLLQLANRMSSSGRCWSRISLPMSRRDIASHLGVAHETISRAFTALADKGCLQVRNRELEITDLDALKICARRARGPADGAPLGPVCRPQHALP